MRRMVRSEGYARARLINALIFAALGAAICYRTVAAARLSLTALPGVVLGLALIGLAGVRFRAYARAKRS